MCDGIFTWLKRSFYDPLKSYVFMAVGNPSWLPLKIISIT